MEQDKVHKLYNL